MDIICPYSEKCPIYNQFCTETAKDALITIFCKGDFERCLRKQMRDKNETVPEKLLPDGQLLD
jgi:hypothetical protein